MVFLYPERRKNEKTAVALLVVSDNSASGVALVGRTDEEQEKYDYGRNVILPDMILKVAFQRENN